VSFEEEFQRREAAFAVASRLAPKTTLPVVGVRQVDARRTEAAAEETLDTSFKVLPSNATGGFGQYYGGCLQRLGLVRMNENGEWEVTSERGRELADAFAAATRKAPYLTDKWQRRVRVPMEVLQKSADTFSLDSLGEREAAAERALLLRLFFSFGEVPSAATPLNRQGTLGQFLHVLKTCEDTGIEVARRDVDKAGVFWPHYYGCLDAGGGKVQSYQPMPVFAELHAFWRQFCAHQFLAFALEEFLAAVLDTLSPHPEGLGEAAVLGTLLDETFFDDLKGTVGRACTRPESLLAALGISGIPDAATSGLVTQQFGAKSALNEWGVCVCEDAVPKTRLGRTVLLLALLYGKWRGRNDDDVLRRVEQHAGPELWLGTNFEWVDAWLAERLDWRTMVTRLLRWLVDRHEQVKFQKRKLDASWLEVANGRFLKQQDIIPGFRASRHGNAAMILQDLGLLKHGSLDDPLRLTGDGRRVLRQVIAARS
ncbi:MAG: hypothetical protein HZA91_20615, partial [Verrucomicrobia bacterium]|nr:hypothetical protein [Verrucomicrobiota bacterium]